MRKTNDVSEPPCTSPATFLEIAYCLVKLLSVLNRQTLYKSVDGYLTITRGEDADNNSRQWHHNKLHPTTNTAADY